MKPTLLVIAALLLSDWTVAMTSCRQQSCETDRKYPCSRLTCESYAKQEGLPFSVQQTSNGAPGERCLRYNDGRIIWVRACVNPDNCDTNSCNSCSVIDDAQCEASALAENQGCGKHSTKQGDWCQCLRGFRMNIDPKNSKPYGGSDSRYQFNARNTEEFFCVPDEDYLDSNLTSQCAEEHQSCDCDGSILYGAGDSWADFFANGYALQDENSGTVKCSNGEFGDPLIGVPKKCICIRNRAKPTPAPSFSPTTSPTLSPSSSPTTSPTTGLGVHDASKCMEDNGAGMKPDTDCRDCSLPPKQACADGYIMTSRRNGRCTEIECMPPAEADTRKWEQLFAGKKITCSDSDRIGDRMEGLTIAQCHAECDKRASCNAVFHITEGGLKNSCILYKACGKTRTPTYMGNTWRKTTGECVPIPEYESAKYVKICKDFDEAKCGARREITQSEYTSRCQWITDCAPRVAACLGRCDAKYPDGDPRYYCKKGCTRMQDGQVADDGKPSPYCEDPPESRAGCSKRCESASNKPDMRRTCEYGCSYWLTKVPEQCYAKECVPRGQFGCDGFEPAKRCPSCVGAMGKCNGFSKERCGQVEAATWCGNDDGTPWIDDSAVYVKGVKGGNACPKGAGRIKTHAECKKAAEALNAGLHRTPSGYWNHVPPYCSYQSGGDKSVHFNFRSSGKNDGGYTPICKRVQQDKSRESDLPRRLLGSDVEPLSL